MRSVGRSRCGFAQRKLLHLVGFRHHWARIAFQLPSSPLTTQHKSRKAVRVINVKGEEILISEVQARLVTKFAELPPQQVSRAVAEAHARFAQSPVRDFVPLLVERRAGDDLSRQAELASLTG